MAAPLSPHPAATAEASAAMTQDEGQYDSHAPVNGGNQVSKSQTSANASQSGPWPSQSLPCYTPEAQDTEQRPCWCCCLGWYLVVNMALALVFSCLLANASIQQAHWIASFPPRGQFVHLEAREASGTKKVMYYCEGPALAGPEHPLLIIDADASHGSADFWPLQARLAEAGRRSCSFDKLGLGFSDRYSVGQDVDPMTYYEPLVEHLLEEEGANQAVMVGWGGGAGIMYEFALRSPELVRGLVFIEAFSLGIEWKSEAFVKGWSQKRMNEYKDQDLAGRRIIFALLQGLAVPWGLTPIFVPANESMYALPERYDEYRIQYTMPKTWTVQWFTFKPQYDEEINRYDLGIFNETSPETMGMPILQIMSNRTRAAVCNDEPPAKTQEECDERMALTAYMQTDERLVANASGNASYHYCTAADCSLSMPLDKPEVVVDGILGAAWAQ